MTLGEPLTLSEPPGLQVQIEDKARPLRKDGVSAMGQAFKNTSPFCHKQEAHHEKAPVRTRRLHLNKYDSVNEQNHYQSLPLGENRGQSNSRRGMCQRGTGMTWGEMQAGRCWPEIAGTCFPGILQIPATRPQPQILSDKRKAHSSPLPHSAFPSGASAQ